WRMQLLLKDKPPPCGGGGLYTDESRLIQQQQDILPPTLDFAANLNRDKHLDRDTPTPTCADLFKSAHLSRPSTPTLLDNQQYSSYSPRHNLKWCHEPLEFAQSSPVNSTVLVCNSPVHTQPRQSSFQHIHQEEHCHIHSHPPLVLCRGSPSMSLPQVSASLRKNPGSQTILIDHSAVAVLPVSAGGSPPVSVAHGPFNHRHPRPIPSGGTPSTAIVSQVPALTGAAAYHP
ncbi:hypothetical protein FHG87_005058, partial [Trinorchestia longiramus]